MKHESKEAPAKKLNTSESVDSLIQKKQAEKSSEVSASAEAKMAGVQEDVESLIGINKPSEKISERKGESGEKGDLKSSSRSDDDEQQATQIRYTIKDYSFPSEEIMIKKIRTAIQLQIKDEWKKAKKYRKNLVRGGSANYSESIAKIRKLKNIVSNVFTHTMHTLKEMYVKYFTPDGKRRTSEDH